MGATRPRSDLGLQPLVLRREPFGGILFDPNDGTHIEVDGEAYEFLREWLVSRREGEGEAERALLERLRAELPALFESPRGCRFAPDLAGRLEPYANATVLGAPTLVDLQLTARCRMGCPHCYASSDPEGEEMALEDAVAVIDAIAEAGVCQLAVGGGEPLLHPQFVELLYHAWERGLVPNVTTTGDGLTRRHLLALADCCGAVALSLEGVHEAFDRRRRSGFAAFQAVHRQLLDQGISTVFQITLSLENMAALPEIVDYCLECPELYGVIFLAYKPAGRGRGYQTPLSAMPAPELFPRLREAFLRLSARTRVGYDCCLAPAIMTMSEAFGHGPEELVEGCSAVRRSVGITPGLDVVPCTFLTHRPLGNLRERSFGEIWHGERARAFRGLLDRRVDERAECRACRFRRGCLGGCPEWDLVGCLEAGR